MRLKRHKKFGSALILTVVLTTLLALLGITFVMVARINKVSSSAMAEHSQFDSAVESVISQISHQLTIDVPGPNNGQEYYDYPDAKNAWLANLEPYEDTGNYKWQQISDITEDNRLKNDQRDFPIDIVSEYSAIDSNVADADGDGVADAVWFELDNITTQKGEEIYAAVRIIDNGGMLNVNTALMFDPCSTKRERIDGSTQTQIDLVKLAGRGSNDDKNEQDPEKTKLHTERRGGEPEALFAYQNNVIWRYNRPLGEYTPFDISDELKLRYRYILNYNKGSTRIENLWNDAFDGGLEVPRNSEDHAISEPNDWAAHPIYFFDDSNYKDRYNFRHISTTYNMDRIIDTEGDKMFGVNNDNDSGPTAHQLYDKLLNCIDYSDPNLSAAEIDELEADLAQIAANIKDYADSNSSLTVVRDIDGTDHFGFERPLIYISELTNNYVSNPSDSSKPHRSYSIELYKRFDKDEPKFDNWRLEIEPPPGIGPDNGNFTITNTEFDERGGRYHVILYEDPNARLDHLVEFSDSPADGATGVDPNVTLSWLKLYGADPNSFTYDVYFGTDHNEVRDADRSSSVYADSLNYDSASYFPGPLDRFETYYWRIDDIDGSGEVFASGSVWEFTTGNPRPYIAASLSGGEVVFDSNSVINLYRDVPDHGEILVDQVGVTSWLTQVRGDGEVRTLQRDLSTGSIMKRRWDVNGLRKTSDSLGHHNNYDSNDQNPIQLHHSSRFYNIGDIGKLLRKSTYLEAPADSRIEPDSTEEDVRLNLADPKMRKLFHYLTILDPTTDNIDNDDDEEKNEWHSPLESGDEVKIPGRININTAPWFVIAQLPWVSKRADGFFQNTLARAIVAYRDKLQDPINYAGLNGRKNAMPIALGIDEIREERGFESIGELNFVIGGLDDDYKMDYYKDGENQYDYPDLSIGSRTKTDSVKDDFEERDLIFARISDLVTVRSDVFTAYILVRIGRDGPQQRFIAILDRSDVYPATGGRVKLIALQPVADPR